MSFLSRLIPQKAPSPEAVKGLEESRHNLEEAEARGPQIASMSTWFNWRTEQNHFGDDLDITFVRKKPRHA